MTRPDDQYGRYIAPKDYDERFEDHPFPHKRKWWPWVALAIMAVGAVVWWV